MPRRGLDRDAVVDAAAAVADAEGLDAVTLSRLARDLGVRAPSLYRHVASHEALLAALAVRSTGELADVVQAAAVGRSGEDALRAVGTAYRAYAVAHPARYRLTARAPLPGDDGHERESRRALDVLLGVLRAWQLEDEAAVHAVRVLRSALHGFVVLETEGGFGMPVDLDASFRVLLDAVASGVGRGAQ